MNIDFENEENSPTIYEEMVGDTESQHEEMRQKNNRALQGTMNNISGTILWFTPLVSLIAGSFTLFAIASLVQVLCLIVGYAGAFYNIQFASVYNQYRNNQRMAVMVFVCNMITILIAMYSCLSHLL